MSKLKPLPFLLAATAAFATGCTTTQSPPDRLPLQECLTNALKGRDFSGVISIDRAGRPTIVTQGTMQGPGSPAMRADAQFNLGSANKMWTAVAIGQLVETGRLGWDDPIGRHLNGLRPETGAITISQLLTHSGGLGSFFSVENLPALERARSLSDLAPLVMAETPRFAPGSRSEYSNSGFLLLGLLVEHISGLSYGDYVREHIFTPAGMSQSGQWPAIPEVRAIGMTTLPELDPNDRGPPAGSPSRMPGPPGPPPSGPMQPPPGPLRPAVEAGLMGTSAGGAYATAADMHRFFRALTEARLTSRATAERLTAPQITLLPARGSLPAVQYGFGFSVGSFDGQTWAGHGGGAPGVNVATRTFPGANATIVILTNRDPPTADRLMGDIQAMVVGAGRCS